MPNCLQPFYLRLQRQTTAPTWSYSERGIAQSEVDIDPATSWGDGTDGTTADPTTAVVRTSERARSRQLSEFFVEVGSNDQ